MEFDKIIYDPSQVNGSLSAMDAKVSILMIRGVPGEVVSRGDLHLSYTDYRL